VLQLPPNRSPEQRPQRLVSSRRAPRAGTVYIALAALVMLYVGVSSITSRSAVAGESPAPFVVVAQRENPESAVSREFLSDAFLKKTTRWATGDAIGPVDLRADSPVRAAFSANVLRRSVAAVRSYWQQRIFSGRGVPPPEVESDLAVIRYVREHSGGVGYVSDQADTREVKVLTVR
jgi:hypothetical protein